MISGNGIKIKKKLDKFMSIKQAQNGSGKRLPSSGSAEKNKLSI